MSEIFESTPSILRWSQSVRMYIRGQGKIGYLTGDTKEPIKIALPKPLGMKKLHDHGMASKFHRGGD